MLHSNIPKRCSQDFVSTEIPDYDTELLCLNKAQDKCCSLVLRLVPLWFFLLSLHSPRLSQHSLAVDWRTCGQNLASNFVLHSWHQVMARHTQCKYVFLTQALGFLTLSWTLWLEFHLIFFFLLFWLVLFSLGWLGFGRNPLVFAEIISGCPLLLWLICGSHSRHCYTFCLCLDQARRSLIVSS